MSATHSKSPTETLQSGRDEAGIPKYELLRDDLIEQIETGRLKGGDTLPSEARLAESLGIARSTVRQALAELERRGIVLRVHGKGTFIHEQAPLRLKKGQDLFALIVPETAAGFYPSLQVSFESAASCHQAKVIVCNSNNDLDRQGNAILQLMDLQVAGVAIVPTTSPPTPAFQIRQLKAHRIPVVCCSRPVDGVQTPLLAIPFEEVGFQAGKLLRDAGHRRIALISNSVTTAGKAYELGLRKGAGDSARVVSLFGASLTTSPLPREDEISAILEGLFQQPDPPTAIFTTFDSLAELVFVLLGRMNLRVPEDVSLVSFGGTRRQGVLVNQLTAVTIDEIQMGRDAVEILEQMRAGSLPMDSNLTRVIPLGFNEGRTLGPPKLRTE